MKSRVVLVKIKVMSSNHLINNVNLSFIKANDYL